MVAEKSPFSIGTCSSSTYTLALAGSGTPRMGPIFGGMLMSGKKVAEEIIAKLKK